MSAVEHPLIVRLNAETFPMIAEEREILAALGGRVVEIEGYREEETAEAAREEIAIAELAALEPAAAAPTLIGQTVTIRGRLSSQEDVVLNGEIEGDLEIPAHRLTIGMPGRVRGDVLAAEVVALGTVEGNVDARQKFAIRASARMTGNIRTPSLTIEEGAFFKGGIEHA